MAWGKIDDGFDDHQKVVALLDEDDQAAAAVAIGLWTLCFTWAHRNTRKKGQTPGLLPAGLPRRFIGALGKDAAQLLVKHKLWDAQDDGGWLIHDFGEYLPTEETRAARAEAGRRGAAKRWGQPSPDPDDHDPEPTNRGDGKLPSGSHDVDSKPVANDGSRAPARRVPTPIPTPIPTPPPPPTTASAPVPPVATPEGEGDADPAEQALIDEIRAIRPEWSPRSITRALGYPEVADRPWPIVAAAMRLVAADRESHSPGRLRGDGPWWTTAAAPWPKQPAQLDPPCGNCDPNRQVCLPDGRVARCPDCHPLRQAS